MLLTEQKAAQYLRMSTDMQRYSIENQSDSIARYAARRGISIVRTYSDAGKSGLSFEGRAGLRSLIRDVQSGIADFEIILVYDVSRWGRFQDSDESAFYEFICRAAGVRVEYCAEQFENDGSLTAAILKSVKRVMAGEFSRELSVKVFAGQCNIVSKGFFIGPSPGYGLRRCLVDESGANKTLLTAGQRKRVSTERVILVPGPSEERDIVHKIYDLYVDEKRSLNFIARFLNKNGVLNACGRPWRSQAVRDVLANEKYIGTAVFNRTSKKLNSRTRRNPPDLWIRAADAFDPVISIDKFQSARKRLADRFEKYAHNFLLDQMTAVWCKKGRLSATIIQDTLACSSNTYRTHFGTLADAYRKIGYSGRLNAGKHLKHIKELTLEIRRRLTEIGNEVTAGPGPGQLKVNNLICVAVVFGTNNPSRDDKDWTVDYQSPWKPDLLVIANRRDNFSSVCDYFILPYRFLQRGKWFSIRGIRYRRFNMFQSSNLEPLYRLCSVQSLEAL